MIKNREGWWMHPKFNDYLMVTFLLSIENYFLCYVNILQFFCFSFIIQAQENKKTAKVI